MVVAGGAGAITDGTGGARLGTQAGTSASAGSDERTEVPPSMLARLASEVSDARERTPRATRHGALKNRMRLSGLTLAFLKRTNPGELHSRIAAGGRSDGRRRPERTPSHAGGLG